MTKEELSTTAKELRQASGDAAAEYEARREIMVTAVNNLMLSRPDITSLVGEQNLQMMKDNHTNHGKFIASVLRRYNPAMLVETVLWVFQTYQSHGFQQEYWAAQLSTWLAVLENNLSEDSFNEIKPLYGWLLSNVAIFASLSRPGSMQSP